MQISLYVCDTKSAKSGLITCISSIEYLCYADHSRKLLPRSAFTCNISNFHEAFLFTRGQFWPSGIVIACVCGSVCVCVYQSRACPHDNSSPIQARITKFGPEMQNTLVWVPIVFGDDRPWSSRSNLTWKSNFAPFWAFSHHYSSAIQARITKLGTKMHLNTVKIPTNFRLDWFWSSLSFSILKPIFLPNLFAPFCVYLVRPVACKY